MIAINSAIKKSTIVIASVVTIGCAGVRTGTQQRIENNQQDNIAALVQDVERDLRLPAGANKLTSYDRYYAKEENSKGRFIVGILQYKSAGTGEIRIAKPGALPIIFDGGCGVVRIRYSIDHKKLEMVECNGEG